MSPSTRRWILHAVVSPTSWFGFLHLGSGRAGTDEPRVRLRADLRTYARASAAPRASTAAFLSFLWPGLGHAYAGRRQIALLLGVPVLALALYVAAQLLGGADLFAIQLLDPSFSAAVVAWTIALGIWRLIAIISAFRLGSVAERSTTPARAALAALVLAVIGMHAIGGYVGASFYGAGVVIFKPSPNAITPPIAKGSVGPGASGGLGPTSGPTQKPAPDRITILLTGVDSGHDRDHALTDTLLVVSVNTVTNTEVMASVPRDLSRFPLYLGGTYPGKINSLMTAARLDPLHYPDGPMGTLTRQIGFIIGIPIDYYAEINLDGFQTMVDLVGGVDIVNPNPINDPLYDWRDGTSGFQMSVGPHHLNGRLALAYVRSRQGIGDSDFTRARRQQQVLSALRVEMTTPAGLRQVPALLAAAAQTIQTDVPPANLRTYLALAKQIDDTQTQRFVLGPPYSQTPAVYQGTYMLLLDKKKIAAWSIKVFGTDSSYSTAPS